MENHIKIFSNILWYFCALAALVNLRVYRAGYERHSSSVELAERSFAQFRRITWCSSLVCLAIGILQTVSGHVVPIFPFMMPSSDRPLVAMSWVLVMSGNMALVLFLKSIERDVAENIARIWLATTVNGRLALRLYTATTLIFVLGIAVVLALY